MDEPTELQTKIIRQLTQSEFLTVSQLAQFTSSPEHEVQSVLSQFVDTGYAAECDDGEYTLCR